MEAIQIPPVKSTLVVIWEIGTRKWLQNGVWIIISQTKCKSSKL